MKRFTFALPDELWDRIKQSAAADKRSAVKQLEVLVAEAISRREALDARDRKQAAQ